MARKYAVRDYIIGDVSYHATADEALAYAVAIVSSAYVSLGFDYMDGAAWHDGWLQICGMYNDALHVVLATVDELGRASDDIDPFTEHLSPDPQQWVSKLAASREWYRVSA